MYKKISVHALNKTGSMFLYRLFQEIARMKNIKYFSDNNIPADSNKFNNCNKICCICPVRNFPNNLEDDTFYIILLRNPLDILISEYYSWGWMHYLPKKGFKILNQQKRNHIRKLSINEYCKLYSDDLLKRYQPILEIDKNSNNLCIVKYCDMVLDYKNWLNNVVIYFDLSKLEIDKLYNKFKNEFSNIKELTPNQIINQGIRRHKRKMYPGDYKNKLTVDTIEKLEIKFKTILNLLNK